MSRVVHDGKVAVLIHPCHGAGWSTWAEDHEAELLLFDPHIVEIVLEYSAQYPRNRDEMKQEILRIAALKGYESSLDGAGDIDVVWIPQGTQFRVIEYDGYERIEIADQVKWIQA